MAIYAQFTSSLKKELETSAQINSESKQKLDQMLRELKQDHRMERDRLEEQLRESQSEKAKLLAMN